MAFLDTSAIIDFMQGKSGIRALMRKLETAGVELHVSSLTVFELSNGWPSGLDEQRRAMLSRTSIQSLDGAAAENAGHLHRTLKDAGTPIGEIDTLIAAQALAIDEPVITANVKHFKRVPNLRVITY